MKPLSPKEVNEDQVKIEKKRKNEKGEKIKVKMSLIISPHTVKKVILVRPELNNVYPITYSPSLFSPSFDSSKYLKYLLEKFWDIFSKPPNGSPLLRSIQNQINIIPGHSLQKPLAYRTTPKEFKKINKNAHDFDLPQTYLDIIIINVSDLTMLST